MKKTNYFLLTIGISISLFLLGCKETDDANLKPSCEIISPIENDTIQAGSELYILAQAEDIDGEISDLSLLVDSISIGTTAISPYQFRWDTKDMAPGNHTLQVIAKDNKGATRSNQISFYLLANPIQAYAGNDQLITKRDSTTILLSANKPQNQYSFGRWEIIDGEGGSLENETNSSSKFYGQNCTSYTLRWTIRNKFEESYDDVNIVFREALNLVAYAGEDQIFEDGTMATTIKANNPENLTGEWSIESGVGGIIDDKTNYRTNFKGNLHESYQLRWTIRTDCGDSSQDVVKISFFKNEAGDILSDIEGNTYKTVFIGSQLWMAENLRTTSYNNREKIPNASSHEEWIKYISRGAYCWYDYDSITNAQTYGGLYNWFTVNTHNLCPDDWHVPSEKELTTLVEYLGSNAGNKLRMQGDSYWINDNGTNEFGFSALPGGYNAHEVSFGQINYGGYWQTSSKGYTFYILHNEPNVLVGSGGNGTSGMSVRCIHDK
ncbi:FISUMP domain-containing protein [Saccharicrinis sp. FJH62]|uniref:FISUMP domain-containing protein n=1 Tax=Saccharicrinis sp. FJH62 TaxID=3344657 RepID=UPI0035D3E2B2